MFFKIKKKLHILHNIYIKHKYFKKRETYAMDGEDLVIADYFKNKQKGFYVDVGINKTDKGIVGDVDFDEVSKNDKALTPVPGGVGPMTIACLLKNTIDCFKRAQI